MRRRAAQALGLTAAAAALAALVRRRRRPPAHEAARLTAGRGDVALAPVAVAANPGSGDGDGPDLGGVPVRTLAEGEDLTAVLNALADDAAVLGMSGGDGSVGCAAQVALERDRTLWAVPGGTLNHFARALGIPADEDAREALEAGRWAQVDVAEVDGTIVVNNASIGVYGDLVRRRERLEKRMPKRVALLLAAVRTMWRCEPLDIAVDGVPERAFLVFVGNNAYSGLGLTGRESLQGGVLDVRVLRARGPFPVVGVAWRIVSGWLPRSQWLRQTLCSEVVVRVPPGTRLAHDGEVREASGDLHFRSRPGELRVLVGAAAAEPR